MPAHEPLEDSIKRASLRIRTAQSARALPVVALTLIALEFALRGRVDQTLLHVWAALVAVSTLTRSLVCHGVGKRVEPATVAQLDRFELWLWGSLVFNTAALGSGFWLVASTGDLTAKFVMTLVSCFYAVGSMVNASSHFPSFAAGVLLNLGQGVLFWLGVGSNGPAQLEVAVPYLAVALLMIGFGKENAKEFSESLRIRKENVDLLERLEMEKLAVEKALGEARAASESKSRFLAATSHDLRQPLHALTMFLSTLSFHVESDEAKRLLGRIKDTSGVLEDQFNSLLDLSKFDVNAVEAEVSVFRLDEQVRELVEEFRPEAEAKQLSISAVTCEAKVQSDRTLVGRVLRNLIANAVKYTAFGSVVVRIEEHGGEFFVEVIDTGPGIAENQQSRIFDEYVQLSNPARQRRHGVGLGLAIVKRIDALLQLRLVLRSATGVGSRFGFHVAAAPYDREPVGRPQAPTSIDARSFRLHGAAWVLDDDQDVLEGLAGQLSAWGAQVETFTQPTQLLQRLRGGPPPPQWIFTDDMLGSTLSGLETAQIIAHESAATRVCLVTGNTHPGRLAQLRASGFPVIVKPARPESLIAVIETEEAVRNAA